MAPSEKMYQKPKPSIEVSGAHGRYYSGLVPLLVVTVGVATTDRFSALRFIWADRRADPTLGERGASLLQVMAFAMTAFAALLIFA